MKQQLTDSIMEQAQVFASAWSLVGGIFDNGEMLEDAEAAKVELRGMVEQALKDKDAEIAALKEQLASLARGVKISIPTETMEHEFHQHYKRGFAAGLAQAVQP